jgi:hypothetical protein
MILSTQKIGEFYTNYSITADAGEKIDFIKQLIENCVF